ncbi:MAG TPA: energy-coupling factor ABC transporter permease [Tepidisphaeraceae bacterium]|nr:energy-coupling factor ABC transporter permease [Tepidisphaeraceae bacterium]
MHIPDGFLDARTVAFTAGLSAAGLGLALHQARRSLPRRRIPLMGLTAAVVFAGQMLNFPVFGGTSGHLVGSVLAGVLVGPSAACVVITAVLILQCLLFSDGGVTALGANVFNMAVVGTIGGYWIYHMVHRAMPTARGRLVAAAFAGWCSTLLAAICCSGELVMSGKAQAAHIFPVMIHVHMVIGLGEAAITAMVLAAIAKTRPELIADSVPSDEGRPMLATVAFGVVIAIGLALFVAPFASQLPDGLEKTAEDLGFAAQAAAPAIAAPIPDYQMPGISSAAMGTAIAGMIGTLVAFLFALLLARLLIPKPAPQPVPASVQ